ncbi:hypothetical protein ABEF93_006664 [Exophiala dermatitidis]
MGLFKSLRGTKDGRGNSSTKASGSTVAKSKEHQHQDQHQDKHQNPYQNKNSQAPSEQYQPPPGPPPSSQRHHQAIPDRSSNINANTPTTQFLPPPGPPPGYRAPHPYPSSSEAITTQNTNTNANETFLPPPGPPPTATASAATTSTTIPSSNPTTEHQTQNQDQNRDQKENPPPYHDWTIIPDTALLPPPPPLPEDYSPTNNASYDSAARAHEWCATHPVYTPSIPSSDLRALAARGEITLEPPPVGPLRGPGFVLRRQHHTSSSSSASVPSSASSSSSSSWLIRTPPSQQDAIVMSSIPLYFAAVDNPLLHSPSTHSDLSSSPSPEETETKTIYFEITIHKISNANSGVAIGFAAKPYPPWRLPGWHRASLGVHGDDGRRFVNDSWGGRDFVDPFRVGETIGVGMEFEPIPLATPAPLNGHERQFSDNSYGYGYGHASASAVSAIPKVKTTAFLTRQTQSNGSRTAGRRGGHGQTQQQSESSKSFSWEIDEERDIRDEGVDGLMGEGDLYAAIGVFGGVEVEVKFGETRLSL